MNAVSMTLISPAKISVINRNRRLMHECCVIAVNHCALCLDASVAVECVVTKQQAIAEQDPVRERRSIAEQDPVGQKQT